MPGRVAVKPFCGAVLAASLAGLFSVQAVAQDAALQFRVVATDRNPAACQRFDAALSRVHSFTATASGASLRPAGGVNSALQSVSIEGSVGLNVAAGVAALSLTKAP